MIEAFRRVPREEWAEMRRRSLEPRAETEISAGLHDAATAALFITSRVASLIN